MALKALRPAMSKETNGIIHVFNMDKRKWMAYLDSFIDRSERTPSKFKILIYSIFLNIIFVNILFAVLEYGGTKRVY